MKTSVAGLAVLALLAAAVGVRSLHSESGARAIAGMVASAASSPDMKVEIGAIDGVLSSTPEARDIVLSDRDGPWLRIDRVSASWSRLALLALKLDVDRIDVGKVDMLRRPAPATETKPPEPKETSEGLLPRKPPIAIRIGNFELGKLVLAEPVLDHAAALTLNGAAALDGDGASLKLKAQRLDAPGSVAADLAFSPPKLKVKLAVSEPGEGLVARLARLPGLPPVEATVDGDGTIDAFEARLAAKAGEATGQGAARLTREGASRRLDLDLSARLVEVLPDELAPLFADETKLAAALRWADDSAGSLEKLSLSSPAFRFDASGRLAAEGAMAGVARVSAPDLAPFSRLAGRDLGGALDVSADVSGRPWAGAAEATLKGGVNAPRLGAPALDALLGERLQISGKVGKLADGGFSFDKLALIGERLTARVDGQATSGKADIEARIEAPELRYAGLPLTGRGTITASVTNSLKSPDANFLATLENATADGRPIPKLTLKGEARDLLGALTARATLDGVVDRKPARGSASLARKGDDWLIDDLDVAIGSATAKGALALDAAGLAKGRLAVRAPNLDDLSAFALRKLNGRLDADLALDVADGAQNVTVDAKGARLEAPGATIDALTARFTARDIYRRPALDGEASLERARIGSETIGRARLLARPLGDGAAALDLSLDARGFNVASRGRLTPGDRTRLDIEQLTAQRGGRRIALARPATATFERGRVDIAGLALALGSGRLDVDGTIGDRLDLTARARAVPLSIASLVDPSLNLEGTLDAEARIGGSKAAPTGDWKATLAKVSAPQTRANGLPALDLSASGRLANARTTLDAVITAGAANRLTVTGSAPLGAGALDLSVKGTLDAALANPILAANGQTASGKANVDLRVTGTAASPLFGGAVSIADGAFNDPLNGVSLSRIAGRVEGKGRDLAITGLSAQTKNGGAIAVAGNVTVAPDAGMPGAIRIVARDAQLASTDLVSSVGDLDLSISGPLARAPKVAGKVNLDSMEVNVPERLPANLKPLPGSTHIDAKGFAAQMLALERKQREKAARQQAFDAALALDVTAPNRVFVRGRGIDAEFGGSLKIGGTLKKPNVLGGFELRRGRLQLLTQRINIARGKLTFTGGLTPQLDFMAETTAADVTAKIGVSGPAGAPVFAFSSSPELPQDEVLSRLLFAKASGSLTPFQAVQLAAALAQFSGAATGVDAFEKMRRALGVDSLDLDATGASGPTIGVSRYIMDGVSVGVRTGARPEQTSVNVGVDVTRGVRAQSETSIDGRTSLGVGVEWEY